MVLSQNDYNAAYFGDVAESGGITHDGGYSNYLEFVKNPDYLNRAKRIFNEVSGKILELGCGVGSYVLEAKNNGLNWKGVDWSDWCKRHQVTPIIFSDALTHLKKQKNKSFNYIVSFGFIECLDDTILSQYIVEMNRVANNQIHYTYASPKIEYYNINSKTTLGARQIG